MRDGITRVSECGRRVGYPEEVRRSMVFHNPCKRVRLVAHRIIGGHIHAITAPLRIVMPYG